MADAKVTELPENTTPVSTDLIPVVDDPAGTPATQKITVATLLFGLTRFKVMTFTRDLTAASGAVESASIGFPPKAVIFIANVAAGARMSVGIDDGTNGMCMYDNSGDAAGTYDMSTAGAASILIYTASGTRQFAQITTLGTDTFILTWTKEGTPTGIASIIALVLR